jgi:hypothetical protein
MIQKLAFAAALMISMASANSGQMQFADKAGDTYEILQETKSSYTSDKNSGSSMDRNAMLERVVALRKDGLVLEYDLPLATKPEDRARYWQFPVQVLKPAHGPLQLLNRSELEARVNIWLKAAKIPRSSCGHWIFTWTAIQIECDPQSVVKTIAAFALRPSDLRDGALYQDQRAHAPAPLKQKARGANGSNFYVEMQIDPDKLRQERAEAELMVADITGKKTTLAAARTARSVEKISGTIEI